MTLVASLIEQAERFLPEMVKNARMARLSLRLGTPRPDFRSS
jgi:hypothetical protein